VPTPGKRSFWLHQAAEYLIGAVFVAQGLQSPDPVVPSVLGGLVMINTACAKGTLSAFRIFGKKVHRMLDAIVILVILAFTVQPVISIDPSTRLIMGVLALVLAFIWKQSDFTDSTREVRTRERAEARAAGLPVAETVTPMSKPDGSAADTIGRTAGRLAGKGVNIYRSRKSSSRR
jgi:hypothetical protein